MFVRVRKVVFDHAQAVLFGRIGYTDDSGRFISDTAAALTPTIPLHVANSVQNGWVEQICRGINPTVEIDGTQFAVDLTDIEVAFV